MKLRLTFSLRAAKDLEALAGDAGRRKRLKSVQRALGLLQTSQRHPSLHTHKYQSLSGSRGEEIFEAYAENKTPAARIFWFYGPGADSITIIAITPHP